MKPVRSDVDLDVFGRDKIMENIECIFARINRSDSKFERHPTGVYFQNIPRDPTTNISTVDHKVAGDYGYFKIDFLNVNFYEGVSSEEHLLKLLHTEPPWDFFEYAEITDKLFHLKGYSHLLQKYKPRSVEDLAMILAIIRPSKAHLQQATWEEIKREVWVKRIDKTEFSFKRCHAVAYSLAVIVNLNLFIEQVSKNSM